jgi:hypothetical protein
MEKSTADGKIIIPLFMRLVCSAAKSAQNRVVIMPHGLPSGRKSAIIGTAYLVSKRTAFTPLLSRRDAE